jgi:hypothetical protein
MHADSSSPGVSGPRAGSVRWALTTRDGLRQEMPGAPVPGPDEMGPLGSI